MPRMKTASAPARDVARAATHLASEAATLARVCLDSRLALDASMAASEAALCAAQTLFAMEHEQTDDVGRALEAALASLKAATLAVDATRVAVHEALGARPYL